MTYRILLTCLFLSAVLGLGTVRNTLALSQGLQFSSLAATFANLHFEVLLFSLFIAVETVNVF